MSISQTILKKIKYFSKAHDDLGIFSSSFFNHIITPIYKNSDKLYSLIYIDLDEVDTYNSSYGRDFCDIAINETLKTIKDNLPPNSIFSRIGGDEYIVLVDNKNQKDINCIFKDISIQLKEKSKTMQIYKSYISSEEKSCPSCLTMAYGLADSKDGHTFDTVYSEAEKKEEFYKFIENTSGNYEDVLIHKIRTSFKKFFNNFRFSNKVEITPDVIKSIGNTSIDSVISMISEPNYLKNVKNRLKNEKGERKNRINSIFEPEEAQIIFDYVTDDSYILPTPSPSFDNKLSNFLNTLICNPVSGFLNKDYFNFYFRNIFQGLNDMNYSLILVNNFGMKNCNRKLSHSGTDNLLKSSSSSFKETCENNLDIGFSNNHFSLSPFDNYIFDLGGGTYFAMISDYELSEDKFKEISNFHKDIISPLHTFSNYIVCNSNEFDKSFNSLVSESEQEEKKYKLGLINSEETKLDLEEFMLDFVDYFLENNQDLLKNNQHFEKRKAFINTVFNEFFNQSVCFYNKAKCNKKTKDDLNMRPKTDLDEHSL